MRLLTAFFDYVDFGPVANSFLRVCGVQNEPSPADLARTIIRSPKEFLQSCGGYEPYLNVLRQLAVNVERIKRERGLLDQLSKSPFLIGIQRQSSKGSNATTSTQSKTDTAKQENVDIHYELACARDIYLIDDTVLQQIFLPLR
jgi:hypothetical protein